MDENEDDSDVNPYGTSYLESPSAETGYDGHNNPYYNDICVKSHKKINEENIENHSNEEEEKEKEFDINQFHSATIYEPPLIRENLSDFPDIPYLYNGDFQINPENEQIQEIENSPSYQPTSQNNDSNNQPIPQPRQMSQHECDIVAQSQQPISYFEPTINELEGCSCFSLILLFISAIIPFSGCVLGCAICDNRPSLARRCMIFSCLSMIMYILLIVALV